MRVPVTTWTWVLLLTGVANHGSEALQGGGRIFRTGTRTRWNVNVPLWAEPRRSEEEPVPLGEPSTKSLTQRIMERTSSSGQTGGAGGVSTWDAFLAAEKRWTALKESSDTGTESTSTSTAEPFLVTDGALGPPVAWEALRAPGGPDYDVVVCGGTLGLFLATSLLVQSPSLNIAVVEAGPLRGRAQEWNLSWDELTALVDAGVLTEEEARESVTTSFEGCRAAFKDEEIPLTKGKATDTDGYMENGVGYECFVPDVLNLGVSPSILLEKASAKFRALGGTVMERTPVRTVCVSERRGVALVIADNKDPTDPTATVLTSRLLLDAMGNGSPIARQQRAGRKPDSVCVVVGTCAGGYDPETNLVGDIIYTNTKIVDSVSVNNNNNTFQGEIPKDTGRHQYFWEAFPVGIGGMSSSTSSNGATATRSDVKTTYMFTYLDATAQRPSLHQFMDDYWKQLPIYQPSIQNPETDLDVRRVLFAYFPTYRDSPLRPPCGRVLAVGDASGIQSPLSFGGFGALTRHLQRLTTALTEALALDDDNHNDALLSNADDLGRINPYTPNLSAAWMFQKAMSVRPRNTTWLPTPSNFVNRLLAVNFQVMHDLGVRSTMRPFLQDVVRVDGLAKSLAGTFAKDPTFTPSILVHVGPLVLAQWLGHVGAMALYASLHTVVSPVLRYALDAKLLYGNTPSQSPEAWRLRRTMDAWEYGSGCDYILEDDDQDVVDVVKDPVEVQSVRNDNDNNGNATQVSSVEEVEELEQSVS